ncbi:septum formation initiator family protein [Patescibacteria group bacterium]|nr:septum formation initiator family protein [Patescibacteria group bacterium]
MTNRKILRLATIVVCLYLIVTTIKAIADLWQAGDKLTERENQVTVLSKEREDLLRRKAAVENPNYWEKVARDQLGLSKPGEEIIIIPSQLLVDNTPVATPDATPNWQKWARLLL